MLSESSYDAKSSMTGVDLNVGDFLYGHFLFRKDVLSLLPSELETPTYSTSMAFIFSEAFRLSNRYFSSGKVRLSIGKAHTRIEDDNTYYPVTPQRLIETGTDLLFLNRRVALTFNYFQEKLLSTKSFSPSTGYISYSLSDNNPKTKGTELILTAFPVRTADMEHKTVVLWMKTKSRHEGSLWTGSIPGGNFHNWSGSLFNQLTWKQFSWSVLFDVTDGGMFRNEVNGPLYRQEGTVLAVRDISFGINIADLHRLGFKQVHFTVSARNTLFRQTGLERGTTRSLPRGEYNRNVNMGLNFML